MQVCHLLQKSNVFSSTKLRSSLSFTWLILIYIYSLFLNMYSKVGYWFCFIVCYVSIILLLYICYFWNVLSTYTRFANYIFRPSYLWNFESSCCFVWKWCRFLCFAHGWQTREMSGVGFWVAVRNRKVTLPIISVLYCPPCSSSAERRGRSRHWQLLSRLQSSGSSERHKFGQR